MKATFTVSGTLPAHPNIRRFVSSGTLSDPVAIGLAAPFIQAWRQRADAENLSGKESDPRPNPKTITITIRL